METAWSEEETLRTQTRGQWEWKVPENAVMQQTAGQAYWINRGCAQQVFTARVPLTPQQISDGWVLVLQQEEEQQQLLAQRARQWQQQASPHGQQGSLP